MSNPEIKDPLEEKIPEDIHAESQAEQNEGLKKEVERHIKEAEERLANQFGSLDAARVWELQEVKDPYSPDTREGQIYFARANLFVLQEGEKMKKALETLGQTAEEGKRVIYAEGFTMRDIEEKLAQFDDVAKREFNLSEAKGRGETKEEQGQKYNIKIQELLAKYNAFAEFPSEGEAGPKYGAYHSLRLLQGAIEDGRVSVDTEGKLYTYTIPRGREYMEEEIEKHRAILEG